MWLKFESKTLVKKIPGYAKQTILPTRQIMDQGPQENPERFLAVAVHSFVLINPVAFQFYSTQNLEAFLQSNIF